MSNGTPYNPAEAIGPLSDASHMDDPNIEGDNVVNTLDAERLALWAELGAGIAGDFETADARLTALENQPPGDAQFGSLPDVAKSATVYPLPRGTGFRMNGADFLVPIAASVMDDSTQLAAWKAGTGGMQPVQVDLTGLVAGVKNSAYSQPLLASRGSQPHTWGVWSGSLPAGLNVHATSVTKTSVTATAATEVLTAGSSTGLANWIPVTVANASTSGLTNGATYYMRDVSGATFKLASTVGGAAVNIAADDSGLTATTIPAVYGTPTVAATPTMTFFVVDSAGWALFTAAMVLTIANDAGAPLALTLPGGLSFAIGQTVSIDVNALYRTGGTGPYTYTSYNANPLLAVSAVAATDILAKTAHGKSVGNGVVPRTSAGGLVAGTKYFVVSVPDADHFQLSATSGGSPFNITADIGSIDLDCTTMPNRGLNISSAGVLSGTVSGATGTPTFAITVTDSLGVKVTSSMTVTITPAASLTWTTTSLPTGTDGTGYSGVILAVTGGTAPYAYVVKSGGPDAVHPFSGLTLVPFASTIVSTAVAATDVITRVGHGFLARQPVKVSAFTGGFAATGVASGDTLYVIYIDADTYKLSTAAGGASINITADGGLTVSAIAGAIFGTPSGNGAPSLVFTASDSSGTPLTKDSASMTLTIAAASQPLAVTLPDDGFAFVVGQVVNLDLDALYRTGGTGAVTYTSSTLPQHGLALSSAGKLTGTVTGSAGQSFTLAISATDGTTTVTPSCTVAIGSAGSWDYSLNLYGYGSFKTLAQGGTTKADAVNNRTALNNALKAVAAVMKAHPAWKCRIYFDNGTATYDSKATAWLDGEVITQPVAGGTPAVNSIYLGNIWLKWWPQARFREGGTSEMFTVLRASAPDINLALDGNGVNQQDTDMTRVPTYVSPFVNRWGFYGDGLYVKESGSSDHSPTGTINGVRGHVQLKNFRGVTGASHRNFVGRFSGCDITGNTIKRKNADGTYIAFPSGADSGNGVKSRVDGPSIPSDTKITARSGDGKTLTISHAATTDQTNVQVGIGVDAIEVFDGVNHGCFGADDMYIENVGEDGTYPTKTDDEDTPFASGYKIHFTQQNGNATPPPESTYRLNTGGTYGRRHGFGAFCGGRIKVLAIDDSTPSVVKNCSHNYNFEVGTSYDASKNPPGGSQYDERKGGPGTHPTWDITFGVAGGGYDQVQSINGDLGFQLNANDSGSGAANAKVGFRTVKLYGFTSRGDNTSLELIADPEVSDSMHVYACKIDKTGAANTVAVKFLNTNATAMAAKTFVASDGALASKIYLNGSTKFQGGSYNAGTNGDFTAYSGG